jgi:hypothetical protein
MLEDVAMFRLVTIVALAVALAACGMIDAVRDGLKHTQAIESDLEASTGVKPNVGFNWNNGQLVVVTVTFPRILETRSVPELAALARASVEKEFGQKPNDIVLGFSLGKS